MRVLLITPFHIPGVGGSSRLLQDVLNYLLASSHEVEVIMFKEVCGKKSTRADQRQNYRVSYIEPRSGSGISSLFKLLRAVQVSLIRRPDVILCGAAWPSAIIAYFIHTLLRIPYSVYTHGEDITVVRSSPRKKAILRLALRNACYVMANSSFSLREARAVGADEERSDCLPPSIDPHPYENSDPAAIQALRSRLGLSGGPVILTVARLQARKGHDTIVRSLAKVRTAVPEVQYLVVGKGDQTPLRQLAEREGVLSSIRIVDYVSDEDLPLLYNLCDVYAMVSRWDPVSHEVEGFGIVYIEAAASGKPCVAGSAGGCADAVITGETGFVVDPESPGDVAAVLSKLLLDSSLSHKMGQAGRMRVRERFSKNAVLPRIEQILQKCAGVTQSKALR